MPATKTREKLATPLNLPGRVFQQSVQTHRETNKLRDEDRAVHDWYRFVLSFPPHLVRTYLQKFGVSSHEVVMDPFCGTGTTLVECKKLGLQSIGVEANPMASFASKVKTDWRVNPKRLDEGAQIIAERVWRKLKDQGIGDDTPPLFRTARKPRAPLESLPPAAMRLILRGSISPLPLHKTLVLIGEIDNAPDKNLRGHYRLALASALVTGIGNLHFGPEVGISAPKPDVSVVDPWLRNVRTMAEDIVQAPPSRDVKALVLHGDSRHLGQFLVPGSVDAVITSPPYPNEKDYSRTTRLESVVLGLIREKADLRSFKKNMIRSNTRGVYREDDDDSHVIGNTEIQRIAREIEARRIELKKDSGFERLYARVTKLYFGGMRQHLSALRPVLRPGARLAYVVGDQASYLRVMIRTGQILADIAESLGYRVMNIDLFRTRLATATREQLREEVVVLRWP